MLAADADLQLGVGAPPLLDRDLDQPAHAVAIERLERVGLEDLDRLVQPWLVQPLYVLEQELTLGVVAAHAKCRLRQVVRAEAEEVGDLGNLPGGERGAWQLDHRAELVVHLTAALACDLLRYGFELASYLAQFVDMPDQRNHDLGLERDAVP